MIIGKLGEAGRVNCSSSEGSADNAMKVLAPEIKVWNSSRTLRYRRMIQMGFGALSWATFLS